MLRKLQRAAARLASDIPASGQAMSAPATDDEPEDAPDESEFEPAPERDPRPRGLYVVGGQAGASAPPGAEAAPREKEAGFELPSFLRKAKQLAEDIKPLTKAEAARLRDSTVRSCMQFWKYADEGISHTNAERAEAHIWRTVDREETELLVDMLIARGMESVAAAQIVRGISNIWNYYAVGLILAPRFYHTWKFYGAHGGFAL